MKLKAPPGPEDSTVSGNSSQLGQSTFEREKTALVLVLIWSQEEPERVGELACPVGARGLVHSIGRAVEPTGDGVFPLTFARLRQYTREDTGPLRGSRVSRRQLRVRADGDDGFVVERDATAPLRVNGVVVDAAVAHVGDVVEVERRFSLLVARRPRHWPLRERPADVVTFPFGQADPDGIVGESPAAWALRERVRVLARRDEHVLVTGASGCGKELVARALHTRSRRSAAPWVARNAATFPEALLDAELFGNLKNYPNPGMPEREGLIGGAHGSTLFLDEIGELPQALQAHLLRVLDDGEYQRLGEARTRRADVRMIGATNRDPTLLKHDLLARFEHRLAVPGLDERRDDVPLLAHHLLRLHARSDPDAGEPPRLGPELTHALVTRRFTTHVRELSEILLRALTAGGGPTLRPPPDVVPAPRPPPAAPADPESLTREVVLATLARFGDVREQAWRALGLRNRYQLKRLLKRLEID